MPDPGSHKYDVKRTRLRAEYDDSGVPDEHADAAANAELQREHPPTRVGDPVRAAGPRGERGDSRGQQPVDAPEEPVPGTFPLRSAAFADHGLIPVQYSRDGGNISPPLEWSDVPSDTVELALLCTDPDAPSGTFTHWAVAGIPATATGFGEGELPAGVVVGRNDFGQLGWGGPRPPIGDSPHRYFFRLFALTQGLNLAEGFPPAELRPAVERHRIAVATLVGTFAR